MSPPFEFFFFSHHISSDLSSGCVRRKGCAFFVGYAVVIIPDLCLCLIVRFYRKQKKPQIVTLINNMFKSPQAKLVVPSPVGRVWETRKAAV